MGPNFFLNLGLEFFSHIFLYLLAVVVFGPGFEFLDLLLQNLPPDDLLGVVLCIIPLSGLGGYGHIRLLTPRQLRFVINLGLSQGFLICESVELRSALGELTTMVSFFDFVRPPKRSLMCVRQPTASGHVPL